jgi:hypothetical protein
MAPAQGASCSEESHLFMPDVSRLAFMGAGGDTGPIAANSAGPTSQDEADFQLKSNLGFRSPVVPAANEAGPMNTNLVGTTDKHCHLQPIATLALPRR